MSESVNIIISASDQASAKLAAASANIDKFGKAAKAGGKAIGQLNSTLGSSAFSKFGGQFGSMAGELIEVKNAFSAAANGSMLFKAAMIGTAAVITVQLTKAIEKMYNDLSGATERFEKFTAQLARHDTWRNSQLQKRFGFFSQDVDELETIEQKTSARLAKLQEMNEAIKQTNRLLKEQEADWRANSKFWRIDQTPEHVAELKRMAESTRSRLDIMREQREELMRLTSPAGIARQMRDGGKKPGTSSIGPVPDLAATESRLLTQGRQQREGTQQLKQIATGIQQLLKPTENSSKSLDVIEDEIKRKHYKIF